MRIPSATVNRRNGVLAVCALLASGTAMLYWPVTGHDFINYDDHQYIVENPHITPGLTWRGLLWSFESGHAANWHPLTWISQMIDCSLYGLNPAGHHLTNLLFHVANTVLVFLLLKGMTASVWRSFFVAAFFGFHPLHVESVAWASERKDVLSAFFWLTTLMAYLRYCRKPCRSTYLLCLILFALGLMSKPMLVTLPFVLLLLDFWPLKRFRWPRSSTGPLSLRNQNHARDDARLGDSGESVVHLVWEKLPLFALTLGAAVVTYLVQKAGRALWTGDELPVQERLANALISYVRYVGKTFWPTDLALVYPYEHHWQGHLVFGAAALLLAWSCLCLWGAKRYPFGVVGWFWYLGTLIPVIGLVQVGDQAMADRYMYIPSIGLFILVIWAVDELLAAPAWLARCRVPLAVAALAACSVCTSVQLKYWVNSEQVFRHAMRVTANNYIAGNALGKHEQDLGRSEVAFDLYTRAVGIEPRYAPAQYNLGTVLLEKGRLEEAIKHFAMAAKADPGLPEAQYNWGKALLDQGKLDEAAAHFSKAAQLEPDDAEVHYSLGTLLMKQSKQTEAIAQLTEALRLKADYPEAHRNLALVLMSQGKVSEGIAHFSEVVRLEPKNPRARLDLGLALLDQNQPAAAERQFAEALRLEPDDAEMHYRLATALIRQHKSKDAIFHYREALRRQGNYADALNGLAWILASEPDAALRAGDESVRLAGRACELTQYRQAAYVVTLGAAYAEAGQFPQAVATTQKARDLALAAGEEEASSRAEELLRLFASGRTVAQALNSNSRESR
jgi:tetratricopeptide (TPR) repeat protein